jgi:hypothetical protein
MRPATSILAILFGLMAHAAAMEIGGMQLPGKQGDLLLHGAGILRKGFVFRIYAGALYLRDKSDAGNLLGEVPKRLDIHYFHHTPKKYMIRAAEESLQKNLSEEAYQRLLPEIEQLHQAYLDGKKGSVASISYEPGEGLTYAFDGKTVITIPNSEFASAYFSIWLGEQPSSQAIKKSLLEPIDE